jgi:hypothetical protein
MFNARKVGETIRIFFEQTAEEVARATGFVQRNSKLDGPMFLKTLVFGWSENPRASLNDLAQTADDLGVEITTQGLDERIHARAVKFMQEMSQKSLLLFRNEIPLNIAVLEQFTAVELLDSTIIALPETLQEEFPGCGGDGPAASLKVQLVFNFLTANIRQIVYQPGRTPDQTYADDLAHMTPGTLRISDLGYFNLEHFRQIDANDAYFLNRLNLQTALYDLDDTPVDLLAWLSSEQGTICERELLVGADVRLRCRVIAIRLPQEVADRRRQKAKENARRKGRTLGVCTLALLSWNIFITNVPSDMLTARQMTVLYPVRWQIELIFKLWKSECALDRVAGLRRERVLCELYAKLIGMVIGNFLMAPQRWSTQTELSLIKAMRIFRRNTLRLAQNLPSPTLFVVTIQKVCQRMQQFGAKTKRRKKPSTCCLLDRLSVPSATSSAGQQAMAMAA